MKETIRKARSGELGVLKNIWKTVFGDTDEFIGAFFEHYGVQMATVAAVGDTVAAAGYLLPAGSLKLPDGRKYPCAMIYSVAVLPAFRSRGLGAELARALIAEGHAAGYPAVALRPASDSLFDYYSGRTAMRKWFYASEREFSEPVPGAAGRLIRLTAAEYARMRGALLRDIAHIETDERALSFQSAVCGLTGGGLFAIGDACAIVECDGAMVNVKEFLTRGGTADTAIATIMDAFPADRYAVRSPGAENALRFGMLAVSPELAGRGEGAWFGPAFD